MSRYDLDAKWISQLSFHSSLSQKEKNRQISLIEKRMAIEEQKELDGKSTGYYDD